MNARFDNDLRASLRRSCGCCGVTVLGFDGDYVRTGLCDTCRGLDQNRLGASGADMLDKVHLARGCPVNVRAREARR